MKKVLFLSGLLLHVVLCFTQEEVMNGIIIDSETNQSIPYANIWSLDSDKGTSSDKNGKFSFNYKKNKSFQIKISSIGYYDTTILISKKRNMIKLVPKEYPLNEIVVIPTKKKYLIINNLKKKKINGSYRINTLPYIRSMYFPYKNHYANTLNIEKLIVYFRKNKRSYSFNIRIYEFNPVKQQPGKELITENLIKHSVKGGLLKNRKLVIDLSSYKLQFPKNGIVIGIENLIIPENKYEWVYTKENSKKKYTAFYYGPNLSATLEKDNKSWWYKNGIWEKSGAFDSQEFLKDLYPGKFYFNPAISVILTD